MKNIKQYATNILFAAIFIFLLTQVVVTNKGPSHCRPHIKNEFPVLTEQSVEVYAISTRTIDNKWVSAFLYQPKDLNKDPITVVCNFQSTNYVLENLQPYQGNKIEALKAISMSNYDPRTWFK